MARSRSGPVLVLVVLAALAAGIWLLFSRGPVETGAPAAPGAAGDVVDEVDPPQRRAPLALGLDPEPMLADVVSMPRPRPDIVLQEADGVQEEASGALLVPAEPVDLVLEVETAMREVLAALCKRADECCPSQGLCDLEIMAAAPMDEVAEEMVKQGGEGARMDEEALDECLVALRDYPCENDFDGMSRASCHETGDGERICEEIPAKASIPAACRKLVRGATAAGDPCGEDQACGGDAVCVKVRAAEEEGVCRVLAPRAAPCTWSADCQGELLCVHGTCSPPRAAGQACEGTKPWCTMGQCRVGTCKYGLSCKDGLCVSQGGEGGECRMEEDCVRGMVCEEGVCRWAEEGEWVSAPERAPDAELPICKNFRRMKEQHGE
jgi:hypothetical protein